MDRKLLYTLVFVLIWNKRDCTFASQVPPTAILPASVVRALPGYKLSCSATGTPPIHIEIIKDSTILANKADIATIRLYEEGNYTCLVSSKYGSDAKEFTVIFTDCGPQCSPQLYYHYLNAFQCMQVTSHVDIMKCAPTITDKM
ncbi:hypothetical protein ACROYT_G025148 [Oculina patagonica]